MLYFLKRTGLFFFFLLMQTSTQRVFKFHHPKHMHLEKFTLRSGLVGSVISGCYRDLGAKIPVLLKQLWILEKSFNLSVQFPLPQIEGAEGDDT